MQKAIQFIGTQRSGSNLLRVMLHQHPEICAPHPPHILQVMMPLLKMYGDLKIKSNFKLLIDDVCKLVELNPVSWNIFFDREIVAAQCENNSLPQIMKVLYEMKAETKNASHWCCKSMASIHHANEIESANIHPFYIFIYRDGRDVALSFMKAIVGEKHIYHLAKQWKEEQDLSIALCEKIGNERCISICYEAFVENPESVLKTICNKIGVKFFDVMLNYTNSQETKETAASGKMWANLVKPVMKNNSKKYLKELTNEEIKLFEEIAGDTLDKLNYPREFPFMQNKNFTREEIKTFNEKNTTAKINARNNAIKEDVEKRERQDHFIMELKRKFSNHQVRVL